MKRHGIEWTTEWRTTDTGPVCSGRRGRYCPAVCWFGSAYCCEVDVDSSSGRVVHIHLSPQKTKSAAMKRVVQWIKDYEKRGPLGAEKTIKQMLRDRPTLFRDPPLFRDRLDALYHLFFVGGDSDWLDGAIIDKSQFTAAETAVERERLERLMGFKLSWQPMGPAPRVNEHSCVARVPDDARPDWLKVAYEAAVALRDSTVASERPDGAAALVHNRRYGREIVADLERRFPGRIG
jgi:hypothetical protein